MAEANIPVDLRNPGQVFACLGLMEAAELLGLKSVTGRYDWEEGAVQARFILMAEGPDDPVAAVIGFLVRAEVVSLRPGGDTALGTTKWQVETEPFDPQAPSAFPFACPDTPATLPAQLRDTADHKRVVTIAHWGDDAAVVGRDNVKFWAGSGGYPGAALARDALLLIEGLRGEDLAQAVRDPFALAAPQSSSFSFDWRRSYTPVDAGFSPNVHGSMTMVGFPLVELLAAIGLQNARPERPDRRDKLLYRYAVSSAELPLVLARPTLGGADLGFPLRRFRIQLGWPGQEGQARCIKTALEDTP